MHFTQDERKEKVYVGGIKIFIEKRKAVLSSLLTFYLLEVNDSKARKRKEVALLYSHQEIIHIEETKEPILL